MDDDELIAILGIQVMLIFSSFLTCNLDREGRTTDANLPELLGKSWYGLK